MPANVLLSLEIVVYSDTDLIMTKIGTCWAALSYAFYHNFFVLVTSTKTSPKAEKPFHVAFYSHVTDGSLNFIIWVWDLECTQTDHKY